MKVGDLLENERDLEIAGGRNCSLCKLWCEDCVVAYNNENRYLTFVIIKATSKRAYKLYVVAKLVSKIYGTELHGEEWDYVMEKGMTIINKEQYEEVKQKRVIEAL